MNTTSLKIVDELGSIEAQIKALQEQAESLKDQLKLLGAGTYAGDSFVTIIKHTPEKKSVAWSQVAKALSAPADLISKYTTVTTNILSAETKALSN